MYAKMQLIIVHFFCFCFTLTDLNCVLDNDAFLIIVAVGCVWLVLSDWYQLSLTIMCCEYLNIYYRLFIVKMLSLLRHLPLTYFCMYNILVYATCVFLTESQISGWENYKLPKYMVLHTFFLLITKIQGSAYIFHP